MVELRDVAAGYGRLPVVHGVSLSVEEGELVGLIGPNGSGKSTLIKALFRLLPLAGGTIEAYSTTISDLPPERLASLGMSVALQEGNLFPELTVEDNLRASMVRGLTRRSERVNSMYELFPPLQPRRRERARMLSGGEKRMLAICSAVVSEPKFLALDEPTSGLAPSIVDSLIDRIVELREKGTTILWVVGESAREILPHLDRVYVMAAGRIVDEWEGGMLRDEERLSRAFLARAAEPEADPS